MDNYSLSSHVLDTTNGKPVANLPIELTLPNGETVTGTTDSDGRFSNWGSVTFVTGTYHLRFITKDYLQKQHGGGFYPFVDIHFVITSEQSHYHVPLLISPFGFSSYRGS